MSQFTGHNLQCRITVPGARNFDMEVHLPIVPRQGDRVYINGILLHCTAVYLSSHGTFGWTQDYPEVWVFLNYYPEGTLASMKFKAAAETIDHLSETFAPHYDQCREFDNPISESKEKDDE